MKTSILKVVGVISLGFLQACGGDAGNSTLPILNLSPDQVTFVSPAAGQTDVCRYTGFTVKVNSQEQCNIYTQTNSYMRLYSEQSIGSNPIELTDGAPFDSGNGECTVFFKATRALLPTHNYILTIAGTPASAIGTNRNSISFTTGDLRNTSCGTGNAFTVSSIQVGNAQSAVPKSTQGLENFGAYDGEGNFEMNWSAFGSVGSIALGSLFRSVFGVGSVGLNPQIRITFNESVEEFSVRNGVGMYKINTSQSSNNFQVTSPVDLTTGCAFNSMFQDNSCVSYNTSGGVPVKNELIVRIPGGGLQANANYIILIGRGFVSLSGKNLQDAKYYDFTVSQ